MFFLLRLPSRPSILGPWAELLLSFHVRRSIPRDPQNPRIATLPSLSKPRPALPPSRARFLTLLPSIRSHGTVRYLVCLWPIRTIRAVQLNGFANLCASAPAAALSTWLWPVSRFLVVFSTSSLLDCRFALERKPWTSSCALDAAEHWYPLAAALAGAFDAGLVMILVDADLSILQL